MTSPLEFSIVGKGLKFESRSDIKPYLDAIDVDHVKVIRVGGNSFGVEASLALAETLSHAHALEVSLSLLDRRVRT